MPGTALALLAVFASSAALDWLGCLWHRARERRAYAHGAAVAALLELVQWAPVFLALDGAASLLSVMVASVAGSVVGSLLGFRAAEPAVPRAVVVDR